MEKVARSWSKIRELSIKKGARSRSKKWQQHYLRIVVYFKVRIQ